MVKDLPANAGDVGSILGSERSPGEGNGSLLQYSCLGNPKDRSLASYSSWDCRVGHDVVTELSRLGGWRLLMAGALSLH